MRKKLSSKYGEELQAECVGKLKLTYIGNNLVLIQREKVGTTEEVIKGWTSGTGFRSNGGGHGLTWTSIAA